MSESRLADQAYTCLNGNVYQTSTSARWAASQGAALYVLAVVVVLAVKFSLAVSVWDATFRRRPRRRDGNNGSGSDGDPRPLLIAGAASSFALA